MVAAAMAAVTAPPISAATAMIASGRSTLRLNSVENESSNASVTLTGAGAAGPGSGAAANACPQAGQYEAPGGRSVPQREHHIRPVSARPATQSRPAARREL